MDERLDVGLLMMKTMMAMKMMMIIVMVMMMINGAQRIGSNLIRSWFEVGRTVRRPIRRCEDPAVWLFRVNSESISYFMYKAEWINITAACSFIYHRCQNKSE